MRRAAAAGVRMYTGDDFNFAELIAGDAHGHSDALLGIFDAIAPAAAAALAALAAGDRAQFDAILAPTVPLSRHVFAAPTRFYKTGVVFLAWLNGHQSHFAWSAASKARAISCIWSSSSGSPMPRACCAIRRWRVRGCGRCWRCTASMADTHPT